jgi:1-aminocyclopropane-1-carboxylate deaminase/D-cysteine desulfhydrase-like pyridoxal-dependent ACC family enzyme
MSRAQPLLFERHPELSINLPWLRLGDFPTRIDTAEVIGPDGKSRRIMVKREDLCSPLYGGNKIRKLEFILAHAQQRQSKRLITVGAAGSHHALATAVHGRAHGFNVTLVLFPQPLTQHVADILLMDQAVGADIRWTARMEMVPVALLRARLAYRHENACPVAAGGSDAIGTLGWVDAGLELAEQIRSGECEEPAVIHVAAGTLGTAAGLSLGLCMAGVPVRIAATRITSRIITNERTLATLVRGAAAILQRSGVEAPVEQAIDGVEIRHSQIGRGYGRSTPRAQQAEAAFGEAGLRLDATYTAKAAADLLSDHNDRPVMFVNTLSAAEPMDRVHDGVVSELPPAVRAYLAMDGGNVTD